MLIVRIFKETNSCARRVQTQTLRLHNINDVRTLKFAYIYAETESEEQQTMENMKHTSIYAEQNSDANVYLGHEH